MSEKAEPGAGDVPLMLDGEEVVLRPSLEACRQVNKLANESLTVAMSKIIERLDFEFIVEVVALGLSATSPALKKQIAEKVYRQGVINVAADVALFIRTIMNGGQRPAMDAASHALDLLDEFEKALPEGMEDQAASLAKVRSALIERIEEGAGKTADPLAESESQLENTIA